MRVKAADLRVGDVLTPTNRTVVAAPSRGARTPPGKVELTLARDGTAAPACFNARTTITVERECGICGEPLPTPCTDPGCPQP